MIMGLFRIGRYFSISTSQVVSSRKMSSATAPYLLSPKQVNELTKSQSAPAGISLLDSTWFMPNSPRSAKQEFSDKRIPGSQFLDLDDVASSHALGLKHMMPDKETFALACGRSISVTTSHER